MAGEIELLREVETKWIASELGRAIANLGYPVGCGVAPNQEQLERAANTLFDRYSRMIEMAHKNSETVKTPVEWLQEPQFTGVLVIDPDGWDRSNFEDSWQEKITEKQFVARLMASTVSLPADLFERWRKADQAARVVLR